ncbi:MAG: peptide deformylase [Gammaproteobacteria bacterium]
MAILDILEFPDLRLRKKATPITEFNDALSKTIDDMFETMYEAPGIGLAATQINLHKQLIVIDISENNDEPLVFINPEIEIIDQTQEEYDEGCLSVPGYYETVSRPRMVRVKALDRNGVPFEIETDGLLATCIQHENDHLNGKLFVDYLSSLKRQRIRAKLEKAHKESA